MSQNLYGKELEEKSNKIREDWFKNHVASIKTLDGVTIIDWREPGTINRATRFILNGTNIYFTGDIACGIYQLTEEATLENISYYEMDYLLGKLRTIDCRKEYFDSNQALIDFNRNIDADDIDDFEFSEIELKAYNRFCEDARTLIKDCGSTDELMTRLKDEVQNSIDGEDELVDTDFMYNIGIQTSNVVIALWLSLNLISTGKVEIKHKP